MKILLTTAFTFFSLTAISATDNGSGTPDSHINNCQYLIKATDNGSGNKATDNGSGNKATDNGSGDKSANNYALYLACINDSTDF